MELSPSRSEIVIFDDISSTNSPLFAHSTPWPRLISILVEVLASEREYRIYTLVGKALGSNLDIC
jgi:hypothetical protein